LETQFYPEIPFKNHFGLGPFAEGDLAQDSLDSFCSFLISAWTEGGSVPEVWPIVPKVWFIVPGFPNPILPGNFHGKTISCSQDLR
jgi:hypothetical protein